MTPIKQMYEALWCFVACVLAAAICVIAFVGVAA